MILFSWWGQDFFFKKKTNCPFDLQVIISQCTNNSRSIRYAKLEKKCIIIFLSNLYTTMYLYRILFHALNNAYPTLSSSCNISSFYSYRCCEQITDFSLRFPQNNRRNAKTMMSLLVNQRRNNKGMSLAWTSFFVLFFAIYCIHCSC